MNLAVELFANSDQGVLTSEILISAKYPVCGRPRTINPRRVGARFDTIEVRAAPSRYQHDTRSVSICPMDLPPPRAIDEGEGPSRRNLMTRHACRNACTRLGPASLPESDSARSVTKYRIWPRQVHPAVRIDPRTRAPASDKTRFQGAASPVNYEPASRAVARTRECVSRWNPGIRCPMLIVNCQ